MSLALRSRMIEATRPVPMVEHTFEAMRLWNDGRMRLIGTDPSFEAAVERATLTAVHKDKFVIRRTALSDGAVTLHVYQVKQQSRPVYRHIDHQTVRVQPLYAEHLHDIRLETAHG